MVAWLEKWKAFCKGRGRTTWIVLMGMAGMLLIFLSGFIGGEDTESQQESNRTVSVQQTEYAYQTAMEQELTEMRGQSRGVGRVHVLLRVSGSETQIYATEQKTETDGSRTSRESTHVLVGSGSSQSALVEQTQDPWITGVVVVCEGGDSIQVKEQVYQAVSVACSISTAQIYVTAMKS